MSISFIFYFAVSLCLSPLLCCIFFLTTFSFRFSNWMSRSKVHLCTPYHVLPIRTYHLWSKRIAYIFPHTEYTFIIIWYLCRSKNVWNASHHILCDFCICGLCGCDFDCDWKCVVIWFVCMKKHIHPKHYIFYSLFCLIFYFQFGWSSF